MEKQEFDKVKLGMKVGFVCGPGEFPEHNQGTVMATVEDGKGFHLDVCEDNGNQVSVNNLRVKTEGSFITQGVGWYLLDEGASE